MVYPLQHISSVFVRVLFPVLARLHGDLPRYRSAYLQTVSSIALVTFPLMGGLFVLAPDFVLVVFGPKWTEMVSVLEVLAWVGMLQSVATTTGTLYISTGNAALALKVTLVSTPIFIMGMAAGLPWGIYGVAVGYALTSLIIACYTGTLAFRLVALDFKSFFAVLAGPAAATAIMIGALLLALPIGATWDSHERLFAGVLGGAAVYAAATLWLNRAQLFEVYATVRTLWHRG
jgi:O-antigen/teichoic acid export membrane protein